MADMVVSGAGTSTVDGTYTENGTYRGYPQYVKSDGNLIRAGAGSWGIGNSGLYYDDEYGWMGLLYYYSYTLPDTPDLISYYPNFGNSPAPTVTAAGGGDPSGALRRTNMNAQMSNLTGGMHG